MSVLFSNGTQLREGWELGCSAPLKTMDCFDTKIIPGALCVVNTFFTVKNSLNAQLIGVNFSNNIKILITTPLKCFEIVLLWLDILTI